ncbi:hypothetical protein M0812_24858 [Anaeramoeba flamelloides]|uniref:Uncharacterized protein n=1 Tax=Anaeramoeba flamelloides TaxID=1746091 RepID=A0AAV7YNH9_9EUKA|nr:hypothetical protein M0812_24858 [Anaeramoeba flamelloides]
MFQTYPVQVLPTFNFPKDGKQVKGLEKFQSQPVKQHKNDLFLLSPPTHSNEFFDKSIFLKNSKPKKPKLSISARVKIYMKRNNLTTRECAIWSSIPGIINKRNGVVCLRVIEQVESYFSGKYSNQHYDHLFRRWLIYRRDSDWKESKKGHSQNKAKKIQTGKYRFGDYTSGDIRTMIKKVIEKSKKTEYKLSQSKIAAIVNVDELRLRNAKYAMQKYLTGKSSCKDHLLDSKFFAWLSLQGKLSPPLSRRRTIVKQNGVGNCNETKIKIKEKKFQIKNRSGDFALKKKSRKEKESKKHKDIKHSFYENDHENVSDNSDHGFDSNSDSDNTDRIRNRSHGHKHFHRHNHRHSRHHKHGHRHHNHKQTSKKSKKLNYQDNLEDLVQNLRSHQRKNQNKSKKNKSKKKKHSHKNKFSKTHYNNEIDQNPPTKFVIPTTETPTLRTEKMNFNSIQIKQRKRKPNSLKKKVLKKIENY